jgi:hypothetical protein
MYRLLPDDWVAIAEARRQEFEREAKVNFLLAQLPQRSVRWQRWTGNSLVWAGAKMVHWGKGLAAAPSDPGVEVVGDYGR